MGKQSPAARGQHGEKLLRGPLVTPFVAPLVPDCADTCVACALEKVPQRRFVRTSSVPKGFSQNWVLKHSGRRQKIATGLRDYGFALLVDLDPPRPHQSNDPNPTSARLEKVGDF